MHAIVKILPVNYIPKGNSSKFSIPNILRYTVSKKALTMNGAQKETTHSKN